MPAKWPAMMSPKGSMIAGNDNRHNLADDNAGGSPRGGKGTKSIPAAQRGGFGHQGRDIVAQRASMGGGRSGSGNPASRGGSVGNFQPDRRVAGHGGSPQGAQRMPNAHGFGKSGQSGVPSYPHANPKPGPGNIAGRTAKLIAGRFNRKAQGAAATKEKGRYGGNPVNTNT